MDKTEEAVYEKQTFGLGRVRSLLETTYGYWKQRTDIELGETPGNGVHRRILRLSRVGF